MTDGFIGEIRLFAGDYAPQDWALCKGTPLSVSEFPGLFALIGTTYGGDGIKTFNLPDLRGRVPIDAGTGPGLTARLVGQGSGTEAVTLAAANVPLHSHIMMASTAAATSTAAKDNIFAAVTPVAPKHGLYLSKAVTPEVMNAVAINDVGVQAPHDNSMPSATLNFIIALTGLFPQKPA